MQSLDIKDPEEFLKVENMMCIRQMLVFVSAGISFALLYWTLQT